MSAVDGARRRRKRATAFRALSPECDRLVTAMLRAGCIERGHGELSEQVAAFIVQSAPETLTRLAESIEAWTLDPLPDDSWVTWYPPETGIRKATDRRIAS